MDFAAGRRIQCRSMSRLAAPKPVPSPDRAFRRLAIAGCLVAILGAKVLLIARLGIPTPYWDQWDTEAAGLYLPWLSGTLTPAHWFAFHNEHRIVLTGARQMRSTR